MDTTTIGWIGLGNMGTPMSGNLIKAGYPVKVYNRTKEKEETLKAQGALTAPSPAALIQQCAVVVMMVSDDRAIEQLFTGDNGLLSANVTGKIIINMSTVSPRVSKEMAALCKKQGNNYIDAPVSGSVKQAEEGQLVIMVGGEQTVFEQAKPVLENLGKLVLRVGGHGAGNTAKLAINTLLGFHAQGLAEAIVFARQNGIETQDLLTLINQSALGNAFIKIKSDAILQNNYRAAFALKHIAKDLRLAKAEGLDTPLGEVVYNTFQQAEPTLGEEDIIAIIKYIDRG
jgi:3-hydroxyisobutyrate dehydrogenase